VGTVFDFKLCQPEDGLSPFVQGLWSASLNSSNKNSMSRWLQGDACSSVLFNLHSNIIINDVVYTDNVILLPVNKEARLLTLPSGCQLAGIHFQPGISYGIFEQQPATPIVINESTIKQYKLASAFLSIAKILAKISNHTKRVKTLKRWVIAEIDFSKVITKQLLQSMSVINIAQQVPTKINDAPLSQRQIERQFQKRMGMTPKQYLRVLRVKRTLAALKQHPENNLVSLALDNGFSDQAHMTRECKQIAKITPRQYSKLI